MAKRPTAAGSTCPLPDWDDTWEEVGGGAEGGLSLEVGLDEAAQRGAVARAERAGRGVGGRRELLHEERPGVVVAPRLGVDQERDPSVSTQLDGRGAALERPGAFEDRLRQVETDVEQSRPLSGEAAFDGLVVPGVDPR